MDDEDVVVPQQQVPPVSPQGEQSEGDPMESFFNMDKATAKRLSESLVQESPTDSLVTSSKKEMDNQGAFGRMLRYIGIAAKPFSPGLSAAVSYVDPVVRGANRGINEAAKTLGQVSEATHAKDAPGPIGLIASGAEYLSAGLAHAMGDEEYVSIARDGLVLSRQVDDAMGEDTNEGLHAFVRDVSQFAAVFAIAPSAGLEELGAAGATKVLGKFAGEKAGKIAIGMAGRATQGAVVDFSAFDPRQERVSNLLQNAPLGIGTPFKFLATNPDDTVWEARARATVEGIFLGSTLDGLMAGFKGFAKSKWAKKVVGAVLDPFRGPKYEGPSLYDFGKAAESHPDAFRVETTSDGQFRVAENTPDGEASVLPQPVFKTQREAESVAATLGIAKNNSARPTVATEEQVAFFRETAQWIKDNGLFDKVQNEGLDIDIGAFQGGMHDVNFRYDLEPEQTGHLISALSIVFRNELDEARVPSELMMDPNGGRHISNAESLARAVEELNGKSTGHAVDRVAEVNKALMDAPSMAIAARVVRQNISQQVETLSRALELAPGNKVAQQEFLKATNMLMHSFVTENSLKSNLGRGLQALQVKVGANGASVDRSALRRSLGDSEAEPLEVLRFDIVDEPTSEADIAAIESVRSKAQADGATAPTEGSSTPNKRKAKKASKKKAKEGETEAPKTPPDKANVGKNTFTLVDEAQHRLDAADKRIEAALAAREKMTPEQIAEQNDKLASRKLAKHDPERMEAGVDWLGGSDEDVALAKERLKAMRQIIADKKASKGIGVVDWSRYSEVELDDMALMHGESVMKLAEEQRKSPLAFRKERTVYLTVAQARRLAREISFVPRNEEQREQVLRAVLGMGRKATENKADAPPSTMDRIASYRAWAMLSKPTTAVVNGTSALAVALYRPSEGFLGALGRGVLTGDFSGVTRQKNLFMGTISSFHDAWIEAGKSAKFGHTILSNSKGLLDVPNTGEATWRKPVSALIRGSERLMTAGDEFAQQISYRGMVYAQSLEHSRMLGITDGDEVAKLANEAIDEAFDSAGKGRNPVALSYAQEVTLRNQLDGGVFGSIEKMAREHPFMRVVFPFTRIPANLIRYQMDRAPVLGLLTKRSRAGLAAGGMQRDEVLGRQLAGVATWSLGLTMANAGLITGGGPKDPEMRIRWLEVNQPYSIKLGNRWISYRRFEPLSTPLGIMADVHDMMGEMEDDATTSDVISGFLAGVAQNLTSKTYLRTLSDFFYAMGSGRANAMDSFLDGLAGSFVPNIAQSNTWDDSLRSTQGFVEKFKARIPGLSETLEARRNIYGEKVMKPGNQFQRMFNPFTISSTDADDVDVELLRAGAGIAMPSTTKFGVDLTDRSLLGTNQSPYDRWMEILSQPVITGLPPLREYLRDYVQSDEYKGLTDNSNGFTGSKVLGIERVVRMYRSAAFGQLITEYPDLLQEIEQRAGEKGVALSGDPDVAAAIVGDTTPEVSGRASAAAMFLGNN